MAGASGGGKTAPFGHQEPIGRNAEGGMMVKAAPTPSFIVAQSEFLFQLLVVPLDDPAMLGQAHQIGKFSFGRESGQPVSAGFGFLSRPLHQQPLLGTKFTAPVIAMGGSDAQRSKTGTQGLTSSFSPNYGFPRSEERRVGKECRSR